MTPCLAGQAVQARWWSSRRASAPSIAPLQALMLAGPSGLTTAQVAQVACDSGWESWDVDKAKT